MDLLDKILRTALIKEKNNVIYGKTGARIYPELLNNLMRCDSREIRNYLKTEFI